MKLLIIRHGPAGDREAWQAEGGDDRQRPLTKDGKKEMRQVARALAALVPELDLLVTSPLVRATQTADIVAGAYDCKTVTAEELAPEHDPDELVQWLRSHRSARTVALVGHEPHLSTLVGYLLTGRRSSLVTLKKSGACLVDLENSSSPGHGTLEWLLSPRLLNRLTD